MPVAMTEFMPVLEVEIGLELELTGHCTANVLQATRTLDGEDVLPGFRFPLQRLWGGEKGGQEEWMKG